MCGSHSSLQDGGKDCMLSKAGVRPAHPDATVETIENLMALEEEESNHFGF